MEAPRKTYPRTSYHENKKALFDYECHESFEAGLKLYGYEVKSIKKKQCNLKWSYVSLQSGRPVLKWLHVSPYEHAWNKAGISPTRDRELLLRMKDITRLIGKTKEKGWSIIVTEIYGKWSLIKARIALARWRKTFEKKQVLKERDLDRQIKMNMIY